MKDLQLTTMCNRSDHREPFCEYCYAVSKGVSRDVAVFETTSCRNLILADSREQATVYAKKHLIPWDEWGFVYSVGMLRRFPEAIIHVVAEELFRDDLASICEFATKMDRQITWE